MLLETAYEHVVLDDAGVPYVDGTSMKVQELVAERLAWGWSPEEVVLNHTDLTLGQVYSALAYFADHQSEMQVAIDRDLNTIRRLREINVASPLVDRLTGLHGD